MGKKIVVGILLVVGIFHVLWYAQSHIVQNRKLPDEQTLRTYQDK